MISNRPTDVLDLISSISNEEVFTPPRSVGMILDALPEHYWSDPDILWFDPVVKTGVFLREIHTRLMLGLQNALPDPIKRHAHILGHMMAATSTSRIGAMAARRTMFGNKSFEHSLLANTSPFHDFVLRPLEEKPTPLSLGDKQLSPWFCSGDWIGDQPATAPNQGIEDMFEFIDNQRRGNQLTNHSKIVFIGNPPYQESDGGHGASAKPIYHKFVENSQKLADEVLFVIPARWYSAGKGLDEFRRSILSSKQIVRLIDFPDSKKVFPTNEIEGGVCVLHWRKNHCGNCIFVDGNGTEHEIDLSDHEILSRGIIASTDFLETIQLVQNQKGWLSMDSLVHSRKPFGLATNFNEFCLPKANALPCLARTGDFFVAPHHVTKGANTIGKWKVICSRADGASNKTDANGQKRVIATNKVKILPPGHVCTETYLVAGAFDSREEAESCQSWVISKLARYLLGLRKIDQNMSKEKFSWVPAIPFDRIWSDLSIYDLFNLSESHRLVVERTIK